MENLEKKYRLNLFDFLSCLSEILDWLNPLLNNHHRQVALISGRLAKALGLPVEEVKEIVSAGILHDIGAISLQDRMDTLKFEYLTGQAHAEMGYHLLKIFKPMAKAADLVRFHHVIWDYGAGAMHKGNPVPRGSHILHIADRISLSIDAKSDILGQARGIRQKISEIADSMLEPTLVDIFLKESEKESFWLDIVSPFIAKQIKKTVPTDIIMLDQDRMIDFATLIRRMIDFRSPFTATHSSGVAATAEKIGRLASMSEFECFELRVAGFLHDLGKLIIPTEIIEKPGKLTEEEFSIMKSHTFYTYRTLESFDDFAQINAFASFHHERLDGTGYPFRLCRTALPTGSRVLAVADVFTAITEDRPYRKGMSDGQVMGVLKDMVDDNKLDGSIVKLVLANYNEVNEERIKAQELSCSEYQEFLFQFGDSL